MYLSRLLSRHKEYTNVPTQQFRLHTFPKLASKVMSFFSESSATLTLGLFQGCLSCVHKIKRRYRQKLCRLARGRRISTNPLNFKHAAPVTQRVARRKRGNDIRECESSTSVCGNGHSHCCNWCSSSDGEKLRRSG